MAIAADVLLAIWDGKSRGTNHIIAVMRELGKAVEIKKESRSRVQWTTS